ncbi:calcium/sodium antiporter [Sunxiuqinia sp. A32]|uniref:calcium/sodium antiporter n=1 Tax=Sunxiuqinia sp. A32 TaxID=3461496 RepID=UPI004046403E
MQILLYSLAMLVSFALLARIVDKFFIASLDRISSDLRLSSDAAGATLMAVGSSAPELFVALFAVLRPGNHEAIGVGSIVGSALFNLLFIGGAVALVKKTKLTWQPILRDILFYFIAVALLLWGIIDGDFSLWNAAGFLILYVVYVVAVIKWRKILPYKDMEYTQEEETAECAEEGLTFWLDKSLCFLFPSREKYYWVFSISILLIAALSWGLVETAIHVSILLDIPESIIALTVLAVGTSVPDLISSLIVAKQGRGDMAVSNAIGSNIFDILVGLGLPFMIAMVVYGRSIQAGGQNLVASSVILFVSLVTFFILLLINKWKVGWITGSILVGLYIFYVVREIVLL